MAQTPFPSAPTAAGDALSRKTRRSRRKARIEREQEARRADLLEAASAVFAEKGFEGAQIHEIAAAAEISLASLYRLFRGKEELFEAVIQRAAERARDAFRRRLAPLHDPRERILEAVSALCQSFDESSVLRVVLQGSGGLPWRIRARMGPDSQRLVRSFRAGIFELCQSAVQGLGLAIDPNALASLLIGGVTHAAARLIDDAPDARAADAAPALRALFERILEGADS